MVENNNSNIDPNKDSNFSGNDNSKPPPPSLELAQQTDLNPSKTKGSKSNSQIHEEVSIIEEKFQLLKLENVTEINPYINRMVQVPTNKAQPEGDFYFQSDLLPPPSIEAYAKSNNFSDLASKMSPESDAGTRLLLIAFGSNDPRVPGGAQVFDDPMEPYALLFKSIRNQARMYITLRDKHIMVPRIEAAIAKQRVCKREDFEKQLNQIGELELALLTIKHYEAELDFNEMSPAARQLYTSFKDSGAFQELYDMYPFIRRVELKSTWVWTEFDLPETEKISLDAWAPTERPRFNACHCSVAVPEFVAESQVEPMIMKSWFFNLNCDWIHMNQRVRPCGLYIYGAPGFTLRELEKL